MIRALVENQFSMRSGRHLAFFRIRFCQIRQMTVRRRTMAARFSSLFTLVFRRSSCHFPCKNRATSQRGTPLHFALCTDRQHPPWNGFRYSCYKPVQCYLNTDSIVTLFFDDAGDDGDFTQTLRGFCFECAYVLVKL